MRRAQWPQDGATRTWGLRHGRLRGHAPGTAVQQSNGPPPGSNVELWGGTTDESSAFMWWDCKHRPMHWHCSPWSNWRP